MKGTIFNIQRYSIHDGPGIRTVVFLKGCPLRCIWCCNPESQRMEADADFGYRRAKPEEVYREVERDRAFYRQSGGGITLSGGEALSQPEFAEELLRMCYDNNIHTAVETSGYADWSVFEKIISYTDVFLFDVKHTESEAHKRLTGVPNEKILSNLYRLSQSKQEVIIRMPFVPPYNSGKHNLERLAELSQETGFRDVHLMPFHQLGKEKYRRLERVYKLEDMQGLRSTAKGTEMLEEAKIYLESQGCRVWIGG